MNTEGLRSRASSARVADVKAASPPLSDGDVHELVALLRDGSEVGVGLRVAVAELLERLQAERQAALELLAVIHRDGGHHTREVGVPQSCADAKQAYYALAASRDNPQPGADYADLCVALRERDITINSLRAAIDDQQHRLNAAGVGFRK